MRPTALSPGEYTRGRTLLLYERRPAVYSRRAK